MINKSCLNSESNGELPCHLPARTGQGYLHMLHLLGALGLKTQLLTNIKSLHDPMQANTLAAFFGNDENARGVAAELFSFPFLP
jgi:hypothetical protein